MSDVWGGLAAMLVALPAAIAYGVAAYSLLGPEFVATGIRAGILGAVALGLVTAVVGGAPRVISSPSAPAAAVLASVIPELMGSPPAEPARVLALLTAIVLVTGLLQAVFGAVGGGRLMKYIPFPVVAGYLSAVAVMIFLGQLPKALGMSGSLAAAATHPQAWKWPALTVAAVTIAAMLVAPRLTRRVPAVIIALLAGEAAFLVTGLAVPALLTVTNNPLVLGPIGATALFEPAAFVHTLRGMGGFGRMDIATIAVPALTLSILLSVDTLKTCVIVDALTFTRHNSNRTLLGHGLGNAVSALAGGMPGSGTMGATLVNSESGGQTRASGAFEAVFVLVAVLLFSRWIAWVPVASLAGILLVVAFRMFDWNSLHLIRQRSTLLDFLVIATVVAVAVMTNLIAAAGAGVGLAILLFIRDQTRGTVIHRKSTGDKMSSKQHRLPAEIAVIEQFGGATTICELQGSLFFGTTDQLFRELESTLQSTRFLILDLRRVQSVDYTATHLFEQFEAILGRRNGWLLFSRVPPRRELREYLTAHSTVDRQRNARTFETLDDALQWTEDQLLDEHLPGRSDDALALELAEFDLMKDIEDAAAMTVLRPCLDARHFAAGERLFRCGDESDDLYLIRRGIVRVTLPLNGASYHTLANFGRGAFFGEMAFLAGGARSADATATAETDVYVISRRRFDAISRAHPVIGVKVFARLARTLALRLRKADADLRALYDA